MEDLRYPTVVEVEVFTTDHHLLGNLSTRGRRFSNWLNLEDAPTITLDNAAVRSLQNPDASDLSVGYVMVNRESMLVVIPRETPTPVPPSELDMRPWEYVEKSRHEVFVSVAPFVLRGHVHVAMGADVRHALSTFSDSFMPVTDVRIVYAPNPKLLWEGEVVLFNRAKAQLYWPAPTAQREE
ncbi:MAG: hypothetical protein GTO63_20760 [Anaerolineae bacterium]|nr:hypothetical protein [Anaerolineae bacterium]NIN97211.1 hypothetical protein [Anaerolineae bacterium]NIQ80164.1 hypothetical protein [Anaerolineae bacterium]